MELNKVRLGDFIEVSTVNNRALEFGSDLIRGVTTEGFLRDPKGDVRSVDLAPYKIVRQNAFVYNPSRLDLGSIARCTEELCIVSHLYIVFYLNAAGLRAIDPAWLYMYLRRSEFMREVTFRNFGSQRPEFNFKKMSDIELPLPPIDVQRKYVAIYEAMLANQRAYERGLDDLKTICFSTIERFRREMPLKPIGNYVSTYNEKNSDGAITLEQGVNIQKRFITPQRPNSNLLGRKIVRHGQFAYCTQLNNANVAIAIREGCDCVVSSVYDVFEITKTDELLADYLMLWLIRPEFGRYVYWASVGSAYEFLSFDNLANYKIPVPTIAEQKSVADIYQVYKKRYAINERLKSQLKDICPTLIRGSIEEASR